MARNDKWDYEDFIELCKSAINNIQTAMQYAEPDRSKSRMAAALTQAISRLDEAKLYLWD